MAVVDLAANGDGGHRRSPGYDATGAWRLVEASNRDTFEADGFNFANEPAPGDLRWRWAGVDGDKLTLADSYAVTDQGRIDRFDDVA